MNSPKHITSSFKYICPTIVGNMSFPVMIFKTDIFTVFLNHQIGHRPEYGCGYTVLPLVSLLVIWVREKNWRCRQNYFCLKYSL